MVNVIQCAFPFSVFKNRHQCSEHSKQRSHVASLKSDFRHVRLPLHMFHTSAVDLNQPLEVSTLLPEASSPEGLKRELAELTSSGEI